MKQFSLVAPLVLAIPVVLAIPASAMQQPEAGPPAPRGAAAPSFTPVTSERLLNSDAAPQNRTVAAATVRGSATLASLRGVLRVKEIGPAGDAGPPPLQSGAGPNG